MFKYMFQRVLGVLVGICRPFNPDNSRLCARLYALPAMWILGLNVRPKWIHCATSPAVA